MGSDGSYRTELLTDREAGTPILRPRGRVLGPSAEDTALA
jgi:hypothetical protein